MSPDNLEARVSALETQARELAKQLHVSLDVAVGPEGTDDNPGQPGRLDVPR